MPERPAHPAVTVAPEDPAAGPLGDLLPVGTGIRHYLDHASTSPVRPEVAAVMSAWLTAPAADPSRLHGPARAVRAAVEVARAEVARLLGARPREVVFCSGATEAANAAAYGASARGDHQVVTAVEHSAVRRAAERHARRLTVVGVDRHGRVDPEAVLAAVGPDTAVVHIQLANHEVGTLQPVAEVARACRERGVLVHVDAAAALGGVPVDMAALGCDLLTVGAHTVGGPPGIGCLVIRRGVRLEPLIVGADQERARRAGTENVPAIMGFGALARVLSPDRLAAEIDRLTDLSRRLIGGACATGGVSLLGHPTERIPQVVCLAVEGVEPQAVLVGLDRRGVAAHSGSACAAEGLEPSPVLEAMGVDAHRSLRLSVGWTTTPADVDAAVGAIGDVLDELRRLGGLPPPVRP